MRRATCHCGALSLSCEGEPVKVSQCHCFDCQRRTGSLFSIAAFFEAQKVIERTGVARSYLRPSASGFDVTFRFCDDCGTSLWWEPERMPHLIGIAVGCFADRSFPMPHQAVWTSEMHDWIVLPPGISTHPRNPAPA